MWLLVAGAIVLVIVIALIVDALGYDVTTKPGRSMQEYLREREKLVIRWFSGNRLPDDERMFEEFYEGDIDSPEWN
jgi:signal peptidase I